MFRVLILKDNYNSFEKYYLSKLNIVANTAFYYTGSSVFRRIMTHYGLVGESVWYGNWKRELSNYDIVIVFDSLHTSKLLKYIHNRSNSRLIYWHWNPMKKDEDFKIWNQTKEWCEHWTFNPEDAEKYNMKHNNQFFFFEDENGCNKSESAFFVGTDKGRYNQLVLLASSLEQRGITSDFHIIDLERTGQFYQKDYMDYDDVIDHLRTTKYAVEIVQNGQNGLTARTLEAMFFRTKLITNNKAIKECEFYKKENIYIIGEDDNRLGTFLSTPFVDTEREKLYPYSAEGWIEKFLRG